jgi:hypothetical protein
MVTTEVTADLLQRVERMQPLIRAHAARNEAHRRLLQHSSKSSARYASAGRLMVGLPNDWVWLSF